MSQDDQNPRNAQTQNMFGCFQKHVGFPTLDRHIHSDHNSLPDTRRED